MTSRLQAPRGTFDVLGKDALARSIQTLLETYEDTYTVLPGHMGVTTLGRERATNPFLAELTHQS